MTHVVEDRFPVPEDYASAVRIQESLCSRVDLKTAIPWARIRTVGGADCSFSRRSRAGVAAVAVLSFPDLKTVDVSVHEGIAPFPYIPGLLSFREIPLLLDAWRKLSVLPDVVICDGQGIAHPRRFGLASHLGVVLGIPTVGAAKSRLLGEYREPGRLRGDQSPLEHGGERIGVVLRTREGVKPLFVSPGHRAGIDDCVRLVLACTPRYRVPETTRVAHRLVGEHRRSLDERT